MSGDARRVALVTGSRGGIGEQIVACLRRDGFIVVGVGRTVEGERIDVDLELQCDITIFDDCLRVTTAVAAEFGRLDVLVNCAGINQWQSFDEFNSVDAREVFETNVWGTVNMTKAASELLQASGEGSVVMVTSTAGERGITGTAAYGMTKAALGSLVRTLAIEWSAIPIRVNAVSATIVPTSMNEAARKSDEYVLKKISTIPLGRMIEPNEVAETVAFLAGTKSSGITGDTIHVDGGVTTRG
ncbi:MAG: short-chain dehydrogenase [Subtercola sp.]|nr:short-chain dehydrogenase [Subtercola sp.]